MDMKINMTAIVELDEVDLERLYPEFENEINKVKSYEFYKKISINHIDTSSLLTIGRKIIARKFPGAKTSKGTAYYHQKEKIVRLKYKVTSKYADIHYDEIQG